MEYSYIIGIILIAAGIIKKNSKIIFVLLFIYMWILFGWNTWNPDYANYSYYYNSSMTADLFISVDNVRAGYEIMSRLFLGMGFSYASFLIVYSLIGLILIASTIIKFTENISFVMALYCIFPFFMDIVQIRNFMEMAIVIFAVRFLVTHKARDIFFYVLCILIAATFHISALIYLAFLLVKIKNQRVLAALIAVIVTVVFLLLTTNNPVKSYLLGVAKGERYLTTSTSLLTNILSIGVFATGVLLIWMSRKYFCHEANRIERSGEREIPVSKESAFLEIILKINIIIFIALPFMLSNTEFFRLFRNIMILDYIAVSLISVKHIDADTKAMPVICSIGILAMALILFWSLIYDERAGTVLEPIFTNNAVLGQGGF